MTITVNDDIELELINIRHAEELLELVENNRDQLGEWLPWVPKMQSIMQFRNFAIESGRRYAEGYEIPMVILCKGKVAGRIGIYNIDMPNKLGSIGYWLGENFQGQGIVTRSCEAMIRHAFNEHGLNRIEIKCGTGNTKSQSIPIKLGFIKEGISRQAEFIKNRFIDIIVYSLLKSEWLRNNESK